MNYEYAKYATEKAKELLSIDSPTGFTDRAADWVQNAFTDLGFEARRTVKGGVLVDFGGEKGEDGLILMAHTDTLGGMVAEVKANAGSGLFRSAASPPRTSRPRTSGSTPGTAG